MMREEFYDEEPWPGPWEHGWVFTNSGAWAALQAAIDGSTTQADWTLARRAGKSNHTEQAVQSLLAMNQHVRHVHISAKEFGERMEAIGKALKSDQLVAGDSNTDHPPIILNIKPRPVKPPHSMTQRFGFRRGRKTT